jgi:hypothetical protein
METRQEELFAYDIPLEQSLQREMLYNPEFAGHLTDWGARPPNDDGSYTSTQDGSVAQGHPMLGNQTYEGATRLAFGHCTPGAWRSHQDLKLWVAACDVVCSTLSSVVWRL